MKIGLMILYLLIRYIIMTFRLNERIWGLKPIWKSLSRFSKILDVPLAEKLSPGFVSNHTIVSFKHLAQLFKHSIQLLRPWEKTKSFGESLKSRVACFCNNTIHAVPINHRSYAIPISLSVSISFFIPLRSCY